MGLNSEKDGGAGNINDQLGALPVWREKECVDCGRTPQDSRLNIEGVIHHGMELRCVERKSCERLKRREKGKLGK